MNIGLKKLKSVFFNVILYNEGIFASAEEKIFWIIFISICKFYLKLFSHKDENKER